MNKHCTIIAHRGESFDAPENTLAAVNLAWERGADAVEIDIRLTKDCEIVVIHDITTRRTGNKCRWIRFNSLSAVKNIDVGSYKDPQWKNEKIPTLKEVLKTVPEGKKLIIEIKSGSRILPYLQNVLAESGLENKQIELISFRLNTLRKAKKIMPKYKMLWIRSLDYFIFNRILSFPVFLMIGLTHYYRIDGLDVWAGKKINPRFVSTCKKHNLLVYVWTVNSVKQAQKLKYLGVNGITSDKAAYIKTEIQ